MTRLPRRRTAAAVLALAAAVALLGGCGTDSASTTTAAPAAQAQGPSGVTTISGQTLKVPDGKPTALFFFSVGCGECAGGAKSVAQAARASGGKAQFLLVDMDPAESTQTIAEFQRSTVTHNVPAAIDTGAALSRRFTVAALSTLIVVDPTGKVAYRATDPAADQITAALTRAGAQ